MQIKRAEDRRQKSEVRSQKLKVKSQKSKDRCLELAGILIFGILLTGCSPQHPKSYTKSTLTTYAKLTLLYEKEKMVNKQTDSSYVIKVNEFFASNGLRQDEFKKKIETISQNDEDWKIFIQDVSTVMDSLKAIGK